MGVGDLERDHHLRVVVHHRPSLLRVLDPPHRRDPRLRELSLGGEAVDHRGRVAQHARELRQHEQRDCDHDDAGKDRAQPTDDVAGDRPDQAAQDHQGPQANQGNLSDLHRARALRQGLLCAGIRVDRACRARLGVGALLLRIAHGLLLRIAHGLLLRITHGLLLRRIAHGLLLRITTRRLLLVATRRLLRIPTRRLLLIATRLLKTRTRLCAPKSWIVHRATIYRDHRVDSSKKWLLSRLQANPDPDAGSGPNLASGHSAHYLAPVTATRASAPPLFGRRKHWARRYGVAPFLPTSRAEMEALGWEACDVVLITGDAYVDHVSFGAAVIGRVLEHQGFRVGILAQPDWEDPEAFLELGVPELFWGVTGGNMDSLVNHYTSDRKPRSDDAYTAGGGAGGRPDRAVSVYAQRCREANAKIGADTPVVIGGIEASLRRIAHYDYWSDMVRRSVLLDAKAEMLIYGNAERAIVELTHRLAEREPIAAIQDLRGTAFPRRQNDKPAGWIEIDSAEVDQPSGLVSLRRKALKHPRERTVVRLPSYDKVRNDKILYAHASRVLHQEANPHNGRALVQRHGKREVWINPPPVPLSSDEMDAVYELPYQRRPHPRYEQAGNIPAYEMIKTSVMLMRGCFGGCSFCSITEHEGRIIQSRSQDSVLREIERIRDTVPGFTGIISDVGGPTANMWRLGCKDPAVEAACRRPSCVYPGICENLRTDHSDLIQLYRKARALPGIKRVFVASGLRYDLAVESPEYVKELVQHHVGGYLKIAPEHVAEGPLSKMMKPGVGTYERFKTLFERYSKQAGKQQYLIPYFIAAHPGTSDEDMLELALWLKQNGFRPDQVQAFLPSPMATATAMYHSGRNPLKPITRSDDGERVATVKSLQTRRLHKAFLRYHDPNNWPLLRAALQRMGRADLIGNGKQHLVPNWQPAGTGQVGEGKRRKSGNKKTRGQPRKGTALTQHTGLPPRRK
ncbi:MAG: YgiQ family radical SAM protein [Myxococcales bacterium]|nr:YgiQ family radical SAM protein [Myxococcales bacterium]